MAIYFRVLGRQTRVVNLTKPKPDPNFPTRTRAELPIGDPNPAGIIILYESLID